MPLGRAQNAGTAGSWKDCHCFLRVQAELVLAQTSPFLQILTFCSASSIAHLMASRGNFRTALCPAVCS